MKKILLGLSLIIVLGNSYAQKVKDNRLKIDINTISKLDNYDFYEEGGVFYSAKIDLINNTDTVIRFWTWSCDWQENWVIEEDSVELYFQGCDKNFLKVFELKTGDTISYNATFKISCNLESIKGKDIKLGFVLIKKEELLNGEGLEQMNKFLDLVYNKYKEGKDLTWSESFRLVN